MSALLMPLLDTPGLQIEQSGAGSVRAVCTSATNTHTHCWTYRHSLPKMLPLHTHIAIYTGIYTCIYTARDTHIALHNATCTYAVINVADLYGSACACFAVKAGVAREACVEGIPATSWLS